MKRLRVGLFGGMANNMYLFAKALVAAGVDACFVRDRTDRFAFSQPVWEDAELVLTQEDLAASAGWGWEKWAAVERAHDWVAPEWLCDPHRVQSQGTVPVTEPEGTLARHIHRTYCRTFAGWSESLTRLRAMDVNLVCGIEGTLLATAAERPYIVMPHGGDALMAAGVDGIRFDNADAATCHAQICGDLRRCYLNAGGVVCPGPSLLPVKSPDDERLGMARLTGVPIHRLGIPIWSDQAPGEPSERDGLRALLERLPWSERPAHPLHGDALHGDALSILIPSRIDFRWKCQDLLLQALATIDAPHRVTVVTLGWGADQPDWNREGSALSHRSGGRIAFVHIPFVVSKPILRQLVSAAHLVVDQFFNGLYGTATVEAMACAAPVMIWIDDESYAVRGWPPPPVINCRTANDIAIALERILSGAIDLPALGRRAQAWVRSVHGQAVSAQAFLALADHLVARTPPVQQ